VTHLGFTGKSIPEERSTLFPHELKVDLYVTSSLLSLHSFAPAKKRINNPAYIDVGKVQG
jgi:hypothetical protein